MQIISGYQIPINNSTYELLHLYDSIYMINPEHIPNPDKPEEPPVDIISEFQCENTDKVTILKASYNKQTSTYFVVYNKTKKNLNYGVLYYPSGEVISTTNTNNTDNIYLSDNGEYLMFLSDIIGKNNTLIEKYTVNNKRYIINAGFKTDDIETITDDSILLKDGSKVKLYEDIAYIE